MEEISITLTKAEAAVVQTALAHAWREVFDRRTTGDGAVLRRVLDELNKICDARR